MSLARVFFLVAYLSYFSDDNFYWDSYGRVDGTFEVMDISPKSATLLKLNSFQTDVLHWVEVYKWITYISTFDSTT